MTKRVFLVLVCICSLAMAALAPAMADVLPSKYRIEPVVKGLTRPQAMALSPDGRIFYLERTTGKVRIVQNGRLLTDPFVTVSVPPSSPEGGLLGIVLHPEFAKNGWVYLYYTKAVNSKNRIERYTASGNTGNSPYVLLDDIGPAVVGLGEDNGGGLVFGNDGNLYAAVGVMENDALAQDDGSDLGKVLQISFNTDGTVSSITRYAKGFRNSAGLAINKSTGTLYGSDNYDADDTCDETNVILSGANYGWSTASCADGNQQTPLQTITPQAGVAGLLSYGGSKLGTPKVCSNNQSKSVNFDFVCSNDATKPCWTDRVCSNDSTKSCSFNFACSLNVAVSCASASDPYCANNGIGTCAAYCGTGNTCVPYCGTGNTCVPACGWQVATTDYPTQPLLVAGQTNGKIYRDVLSGAAYDTLVSQSPFYDPVNDPQGAANCPRTPNDIEEGKDGAVYLTADDATTARAGIYRIVYDDFGQTEGAKPREVSGSPYFRMTANKDAGGGLKLSFEDLKSDAWGCTTGHCPTGSHSSRYSVWSGSLVQPFAYSHTVLAETNGAVENDALLSYVQSPMPSDSRYYLVSARAGNLEGTLGTRSDGVTERPGYAQSDVCTTIGYGASIGDMNKCTQDWPHPYPDQDNRLWTMSDFRGKTVVMSFGQYG